MSLCIALDFDGVITADPKFWTFFASDAVVHGHRVITVTHRRKTFENAQAMRNLGVNWDIVFAYDQPKKLAAIKAGYAVDIWIDDNPHGIGDGSENVATQSVFEIELRNAYTVIRRAIECELSDGARSGPLPFLIERLKTVLVKP